jgi:hypothetical protein
MNPDEQRLAKIKDSLDSYKIELGVATKELKTLEKELLEKYDLKTVKGVELYLERLDVELKELKEKKELKFNSIEAKLKTYRR